MRFYLPLLLLVQSNKPLNLQLITFAYFPQHQPVPLIFKTNYRQPILHSAVFQKIIFSGRNGHIVEAIAFNSKGGALEGYLSKSCKKELNIAGKFTLNEWQGKKKIEFIIQDVAIQ